MDKHEFFREHTIIRRITMVILLPIVVPVLFPLDWWEHGFSIWHDYVDVIKQAW